MVVPDFTPVTFPLPFTVATELSATDQVTAVVMPWHLQRIIFTHF